MHPETLREHIQKCKAATDKPFGVNIPLMYPEIDILINMVIEEGVRIVFTSAGNPKTWTEHLHEHGIIVAHVVASTKFAAKCEEAGVDAIVAEGFEAGGHNGREETTRICSRSVSGCMEPAPIRPSPPALLTAEASRHPLHHTIPP